VRDKRLVKSWSRSLNSGEGEGQEVGESIALSEENARADEEGEEEEGEEEEEEEEREEEEREDGTARRGGGMLESSFEAEEVTTAADILVPLLRKGKGNGEGRVICCCGGCCCCGSCDCGEPGT